MCINTADVVNGKVSNIWVIHLPLHARLVAMSVQVNIGNVTSTYLCNNAKVVSTAMQTLSAALFANAASTDQLSVEYPPYHNNLSVSPT